MATTEKVDFGIFIFQFKYPETLKARSIFTRGLGIQGQLGLKNRFKNVEAFKPIKLLQDQNITHFRCDHSQNLAVINSQSIVFWGWPLCTRTTYKFLDMYDRVPGIVRLLQNLSPIFRSGYEEPVIEIEFNDSIIKKIDMGCGFISVIDNDDKLYMWGDNYAGQLGQGDDVHRDFPVLIQNLIDKKIADVSCGFQHCLIIDSHGTAYGVGKNTRYQLGKIKRDREQSREINDKYGLPTSIPEFFEPIVKIQAGKYHSLFLTESGRLYSLGSNRFGQCGAPAYLHPIIEKPQEILLDGLKIKQMSAGNHHNLILSEEGKVYAFGSKSKGQIDGKIDDGREEQCGIMEIELPSNSKVVKVQASNIRSCAHLENGEIWFWGGYFYKEKRKLNIIGFNLLNEEEGIPTDHKIVDFQMGFAHDVIMTEKDTAKYINSETDQLPINDNKSIV